jgi:hypothetical protein
MLQPLTRVSTEVVSPMARKQLPDPVLRLLDKPTSRTTIYRYSVVGLTVSVLLCLEALTAKSLAFRLWLFIVTTALVIPAALFAISAVRADAQTRGYPTTYQFLFSTAIWLRVVGVLVISMFLLSLVSAVASAANSSDPSAGIPGHNGDYYFVQNGSDKHEVTKSVYRKSLARPEALMSAVTSWFYWAAVVSVYQSSGKPLLRDSPQ